MPFWPTPASRPLQVRGLELKTGLVTLLLGIAVLSRLFTLPRFGRYSLAVLLLRPSAWTQKIFAKLGFH
jgi:hypothetical protein